MHREIIIQVNIVLCSRDYFLKSSISNICGYPRERPADNATTNMSTRQRKRRAEMTDEQGKRLIEDNVSTNGNTERVRRLHYKMEATPLLSHKYCRHLRPQVTNLLILIMHFVHLNIYIVIVHDPYEFIYQNLPPRHILRNVPDCCSYYGAMRFQYETPGFCCRKGKVQIHIPEVPT